jgi:hypothetical protein
MARGRFTSHAPFLPRPPPSITPSFDPIRYTASTLRLSFRAITVFVFSRASDFSIRISSFVHGRLRVTFFAISIPHTNVATSLVYCDTPGWTPA